MNRASRVFPLTRLFVALTAQAALPSDKPQTEEPAPIPTTLAGETDENQDAPGLPVAIRIGLDNSEIIRVLYLELPTGIMTERHRRDPGPFLTDRPYVEATLDSNSVR